MSNFKNSDVSFVIPSRSNLKYLKWCYSSIRKNIGSDIWICYADDASTDGTKDWLEQISKEDSFVKYLINDTGKRLGHTILYDKIVNELVETPLAIIAHADMFWLPNSIDNMLKHIKPMTIVSATRIEPSLHPQGPEKHIIDMGEEPEEFKEALVLEYAKTLESQNRDKTTNGVFAPWMFFKQDFQAIGGHDPLYAPQSKEDSDIWNRMLLNGYKFVQSRDSFVAHLTCRGSRFNPTLTTPGTNSAEWNEQNMISSRNFIRKWGHFVKHDQFLMPEVPPKFNIAFEVKNCDYQYIVALEPWCDILCVDNEKAEDAKKYIETEQVRAKSFDLSKRVNYSHIRPHTDVTVSFDTRDLTQERFQILTQLPEILAQNEDTGTFELDIFKVQVNRVQTYEHQLINIKTEYN